jgi:hypothetical protein
VPTNRRRRRRQTESSLREQGFLYFGPGDFFDEAEAFAALPEAERLAFWQANRAAIVEAYHTNPAHAGTRTWGEILEEPEASSDAN